MTEEKITITIDPETKLYKDILQANIKLNYGFVTNIEDAIKFSIMKFVVQMPYVEDQNIILKNKLNEKDREIEQLQNIKKLYESLYSEKTRFCEILKKAAKENRIKDVIEA